MTVNPGPVDSIMFDSFTTIVDVQSSTKQALDNYVDDPEPIAKLWRFRAIDYRMISTYTKTYETYMETTKKALEYALQVHDIELSSDIIDEITAVFFELEVYKDVQPGMETLIDKGYDLYILSNGNPEVLDAMIKRAQIGDLIKETISADEIEIYKPDRRIYEYAVKRIGTSKERILHVATPWYDIYGAKHAGIQTIWLNRDGKPWDRFNGDPDLIVKDFGEVVDAFNSFG